MGTLLIVLGIAASLIGGHLFIRWQRKKLAAERARKLEVADGVFSNAPAAPAKRPRKKKSWLSLNKLPELPELILLSIRRSLPLAVEKLLQARHALQAAQTALAQAEQAYLSAQKQSALNGFPKCNRGGAGEVVATLSQQQLSLRQLARAGGASRIVFDEALRAHKRAAKTLEFSLAALVKYDLTLLDSEDERLLEISRIALTEGKDSVYRPSIGKVELLPVAAEPLVPSPQVASLVEQLVDAVTGMVGAVSAARTAGVQTRSAQDALSAARIAPGPPAPQKPIEQDVSAWMQSANVWAESLQAAKQEMELSLPPLWATIADCDIRLAAIIKLHGQISALEEELRAKVKVEPLESKPTWPATFDFASADGASFGDDLSDPMPAAAKPASVLTDEQESKRLISSILWTEATRLLDGIRKSPQSKQLWLEGKLGDEDKSRLAAAQAAVRKLGYALAQHNTAAAKLTHAKQEALPEVTADSTLEEPIVESYIRSHRRHRQDKVSRAKSSAKLAERIQTQEAQLSERRAHITQCAADVAEGIRATKAERNVLPREVHAAVKVGDLLVAQATKSK